MSIKWKEIKEICKKYNISLGYTDIRFADIPFTKQFFKRRPKYQIFLYDGNIQKNDDDYLPTIQHYTGNGYSNYENAPLFFNIPNSYEGLSSWEIDEFLEKGTMPQSHFRKWYGKWRAIYTAKDFEKAILELKEHLELGTKIQTYHLTEEDSCKEQRQYGRAHSFLFHALERAAAHQQIQALALHDLLRRLCTLLRIQDVIHIVFHILRHLTNHFWISI